MERKVLVAMAIGVFALMAIIIIEGTVMAGLSAEAQREAEQARRSLTGAEKTVSSARSEIEAMLSSRAEVLGGIADRENWTGTLIAATDRLGNARKRYEAEVETSILPMLRSTFSVRRW